MKAANAILLIMALQGSVALSQTTPTEKASASGTCSTAPVGDNNAHNINCNGTGVDQGVHDRQPVILEPRDYSE
jgi:hypothetical protein